MKKHLPIIILLLLGIATHFVYFGHPRQVVFDEVHFGGFSSGYFTHEYFFDIHPPLGKLIIAGAGYLDDFKPSTKNDDGSISGGSFSDIGNKFPDDDNTYKSLRLMPMLAGILLPLVIYLIALEIGISVLASFLAGLLIVFDNALLVQSRFMLLDAFLLLFGFFAFLLYLRFLKNSKLLYLIGAFLFSSFAMSIKWTGLTFIVVIMVAEVIRIVKEKKWKNFIVISLLFVGSIIVYSGFFYVHLKLLYKSGPGDDFMSQEFKATLKDSDVHGSVMPLSILYKIVELNDRMYTANAGLTATHPYSTVRYTDKEKCIGTDVLEKCSPKHELGFYTWPLMARPIYYWNQVVSPLDTEPDLKKEEKIYLIGNPFIWWASAFGILYLFLSMVMDIPEYIKKLKKPSKIGLILLLVYLFNFLPFAGINRSLFLYHYFSAFVISVIVFAWLFDKIQVGKEKKKKLFLVIVVASILFFLFYAPLSYGTPLTKEQFNQRAWFDSWDRLKLDKTK